MAHEENQATAAELPQRPPAEIVLPSRRLMLEHRGGGSGEDGSEAWVTTYMDLLTLLLTLFVLLLSYAGRDEGEFEEVTQAMAEASRGLLDGSPQVVSEPDVISPFEQLLLGLQQRYSQAGLGDAVELLQGEGKLEIQLSERLMFESAEAELGPQAEPVLLPLLDALRQSSFVITVEGHTDNLPIYTERYPSNWELSAARASSVVRYLINGGIAAARLRAIGYASTRPIADNADEQGRRRNRRVTLKITRGEMDGEAALPPAQLN